MAPAVADDKAKAAEHYRQGRVFEKAKAYDQAIAEFQQAYALDHLPDHLFNIGFAYEQKPDLKNALDYFQRYLTAQPTGPKAAEARTRIKADTQQLVDQDVKRRDDEARIAAEQKKAKDEQDAAAKKAKDEQDAAAKTAAVVAHVKQAVAYGQAGSWVNAGEEHRAAAAIDGDPQHLIDAADAFHKQPDDVRARGALLAYLEKVPAGAASDKIRVRVAELTRSIEKAEAAGKVESQRLAASQLAATFPGPPADRTTFGFEARGGIYGTGSFVIQTPNFMEVKHYPGPALGFGAFVDLPLSRKIHVHLGARVWSFNSTFKDDCDATVMCPTKITAKHFGPALTVEQSLIRGGRLNVFGIGGGSLEIPLGKPSVSFNQGGPDQELQASQMVQFEFGLGARFGGVGLSAVFQISPSKFTSDLDLGHSQGIMFGASWQLPR